VSENPSVFEDIFIPILFSRQFLLHTERPAQFEERFFNIAHRISWWAYANFFQYINPAWNSTNSTLKNMKQAAMTYKLGRPAEVPLDTMSVSYYHKCVRERLLLDRRSDEFNENDGGWQVGFIQIGLEEDDFVKYPFLSIISRWPTDIELSTLRQIFEDRNFTTENYAEHQAMIVMDYLSRLSETYYLNALD
ncbi:MAG: hypothetical protein PVG41_13995, partial [Desulfobacteraceae bacterium]